MLWPLVTMLMLAGAPPGKPMNTDGKTFVQELAGQHPEAAAARFDARMAKAMSAEQLAQLWKGLVAQFGDFQSVERVDVDRVEGYRRDTAICAFAHGKMGLRVVIDAEGRVAGLFVVPGETKGQQGWAAPPYVDSARFEERLVKVGPLELPGALCLPRGAAKFPVVVFVSGSGPNDMDESSGPIKIFRDLAQGLASRGVATLRYDKRTFAKKGRVRTVMDEYADDANAAVALAAALPGAERVVLLGHSQGASLAPRIAQHNPHIAGLIMLAGSTWPLPKAMVAQLEYQQAKGFLSGEQAQTLLAQTRAEAKRMEDPALKAGDDLGHGVTGAYVLDLRGYDPVKVASALKLPILMAWGERDLKVIPDDFAGWRAGLGERPDLTIHTYPGLQHLLTPVGTDEVYHVAPQVVDDLAHWLGH